MAAEVVRLTDADTGATADVLVSLGFNCFSWKTPFGGSEPRELLWAESGFETGDKRPSRSGIPLLAPFAGRIAGAHFDWEGKSYELAGDDGLGNAIHGFALDAPWRVIDRSNASLTAEFRPADDAPDAVRQWPSDYRLTATYRIGLDRLDFDFHAENLGDESMPFGFGTHAYFRLPLAERSDPEATVVTAAVDAEWASEALIPTGEATLIAANDPLPAGAPLAGREFDTPFRFAPGGGTTELVDPISGRSVRQTYDESMTCCVIYTPGHREAICLEPYTATPNPIAMQAAGVEAGLRVLAPGETYRTSVSLVASPSPIA